MLFFTKCILLVYLAALLLDLLADELIRLLHVIRVPERVTRDRHYHGVAHPYIYGVISEVYQFDILVIKLLVICSS